MTSATVPFVKGDAKAGKNLKYNCYNAIKYYNDGAIVANYKIEDNALVLKTWHKLKTEGEKDNLKKI